MEHAESCRNNLIARNDRKHHAQQNKTKTENPTIGC